MKKNSLALSLQYFLGAFFIFSALLKINDPLGLAYKIDEYFDIFQWLAIKKFSFLLAILMNMLEFAIGLALLMNVWVNLMRWLMMGLLVFFTFLTGFAYFSESLKECGCLGNCIPLTAGVSFVKDLVLIGLNVLLFIIPTKYKPISISAKIAFSLCVGFSYILQAFIYTLMPVWDCMPFQVGTHIPTGIEKYNQQVSRVQMFFVYQKNGQEVRFDADHFPADFDSTYVYIRREDEPIGEKDRMAIADFMFYEMKQNTEISHHLLNTDSVKIVLVLNDLGWSKLDKQIKNETHLLSHADGHVYIASYDEKRLLDFFHKYNLPLNQALLMDNVLLKTMGRSPLTVFSIHQGTIIDKRGTLFYNSLF